MQWALEEFATYTITAEIESFEDGELGEGSRFATGMSVFEYDAAVGRRIRLGVARTGPFD